jgi:hypothetical protein
MIVLKNHHKLSQLSLLRFRAAFHRGQLACGVSGQSGLVDPGGAKGGSS